MDQKQLKQTATNIRTGLIKAIHAAGYEYVERILGYVETLLPSKIGRASCRERV